MNHGQLGLQTLYGKRIQILQPTPKIQVSTRFEWITEDCRKKMNSFLIGRFGFHEQKDEIYELVASNTLIMPEHIYKKLLVEIKNQGLNSGLN